MHLFCGVLVLYAHLVPHLFPPSSPSPPPPLPFPLFLTPSALGEQCGDKYCFNGGRCVAESCDCMDSYTGEYCQYRDCELGTSVNNRRVHVCGCHRTYVLYVCVPAFPGDSPCLNGGTCVSGEYNAYCACDNGYTGYNCDTSELCVLYKTHSLWMKLF